MASNYIVDTEIKITRDREANGEDVHLYPLLLTPTPKVALDKLKDKVIRPRDAKPLSAFPYASVFINSPTISLTKSPQLQRTSPAESRNRRRALPSRHSSTSLACPRPPTNVSSAAMRNCSASTRRGPMPRLTSSRSSPRAARASRRWSTNGSSACRPTTIAAPRRCSAGRSTARVARSARPQRTNSSTGRSTSSASRLRPPVPAPRPRRSRRQ